MACAYCRLKTFHWKGFPPTDEIIDFHLLYLPHTAGHYLRNYVRKLYLSCSFHPFYLSPNYRFKWLSQKSKKRNTVSNHEISMERCWECQRGILWDENKDCSSPRGPQHCSWFPSFILPSCITKPIRMLWGEALKDEWTSLVTKGEEMKPAFNQSFILILSDH